MQRINGQQGTWVCCVTFHVVKGVSEHFKHADIERIAEGSVIEVGGWITLWNKHNTYQLKERTCCETLFMTPLHSEQYPTHLGHLQHCRIH